MTSLEQAGSDQQKYIQIQFLCLHGLFSYMHIYLVFGCLTLIISSNDKKITAEVATPQHFSFSGCSQNCTLMLITTFILKYSTHLIKSEASGLSDYGTKIEISDK